MTLFIFTLFDTIKVLVCTICVKMTFLVVATNTTHVLPIRRSGHKQRTL